MDNQKRPPVTRGPQQGESLSVVGDTYRILISGEETGGAFAAIDMLIPPGGGPGPHAHADFEESFYVVEGEIEVKSELGNYVAVQGSFVNIPKGGVVHGFTNNTEQVAHLLCTVVPAGLDAFFKEIGKPVATGEFLPPPPMDEPEEAEKMKAIAERYGQKIYPPDYLK